jgi:prepilin-type N-terminal cleavage/methylation domain-containing protein
VIRPRAREAGFTLPELLVAITILGIIIVAIGAMITTAFRTSSTVSNQLQGSRGPKVVSRYWVPDVEQAEQGQRGIGGCGPGLPVVSFLSHDAPSAFDHPEDLGVGQVRTVTWSVQALGAREQLVRTVCAPGAPPDRLVMVSDLKVPPTVDDDAPQWRIDVTVPDHSRDDGQGQYAFSVTAAQQITTTTSTT